MTVDASKVRSFRWRAHHLDKKLPLDRLVDAAGACGLQNSPPGAWETALFNRLKGCTLDALDNALYRDKTLLQAWSYRGVPVVFPVWESDVFLTPLIAREDEQPWIYTRGITGALDYLQMPFDDLLLRTMKAASYLDEHTIQSKAALDQTLADVIQADLPADKHALWRAPSMYGSPDKQTVGGAAVSFLLRPCAFYSLVVFGRRQGTSPTFTSFSSWLGRAPAKAPGADGALIRKFLHCYGPATPKELEAWLGCSGRQAKRIWGSVSDEITPVAVEGKTRYVLAEDLEDLLSSEPADEKLVLLGPHDPYLDLRDRAVILPDKTRQKAVWQYVSNPGAVMKGGRVAGVWKTKTAGEKLEVSVTVWERLSTAETARLGELAEEYAAFRQLTLRSCAVEKD